MLDNELLRGFRSQPAFSVVRVAHRVNAARPCHLRDLLFDLAVSDIQRPENASQILPVNLRPLYLRTAAKTKGEKQL